MSFNNKINIAIDGPSGSGKGVTAKRLAKKLNYNYLDTGSMYRAIGYYMYINNITESKFNESILDNINIEFNENNEVILNSENIENKIRNPEISMMASNFSKIKAVREFLVKQQQQIVKNKGFIAEGRDIGSVVIPDAELKIYLNADIKVRAKRRLLDYEQQNKTYTLNEVEKELEKRDYQDMNRTESPLIKTDDAIEVDTTNCTINEQIDIIYNLAIKK